MSVSFLCHNKGTPLYDGENAVEMSVFHTKRIRFIENVHKRTIGRSIYFTVFYCIAFFSLPMYILIKRNRKYQLFLTTRYHYTK